MSAPALCAPAAGHAAAAAAASATTTASGSKRPLGGGATEHDHDHEQERRVQPRLDSSNTDENPQGNAAADAISHAPARGQSSPPAAAGRLHRHTLECVFAFLSLRELAFALRVSRSWMGAVRSMRRLALALEWTWEPVRVVAQSLMGRHICRLGGDRHSRLGGDRHSGLGGAHMRLSGADVSVIADRMAHLRELLCQLDPPSPGQPLRFPAALRQLDIEMLYGTTADSNAAIAAISRLPLLDGLRLALTDITPHISFAPLAALLLLRSFTFMCERGVEKLSDAQVDELRALTRLRELHVIMDMTTALLRQLLRRPHGLQLQQIPLPCPFDDEVAALLPQLPSLTQIGCFGFKCNRFDWLRQLPNLTDVGLNFESAQGAAGRIEALVAALQCCSSIEILSLSYCSDLTAAHLAELLPRLPRLRELALRVLRIGSLAFLSQPPLISQLRRLVLDYCGQLPSAELRHVHALRGLEQLELTNSFVPPLDRTAVRALLTPPSALLPRLHRLVLD